MSKRNKKKPEGIPINDPRAKVLLEKKILEFCDILAEYKDNPSYLLTKSYCRTKQ